MPAQRGGWRPSPTCSRAPERVPAPALILPFAYTVCEADVGRVAAAQITVNTANTVTASLYIDDLRFWVEEP